MHAPVEVVYALAAAVERWPELLPHYRWVTILQEHASHRLVEMAASRDGVPLQWRAEQRCDPVTHCITFRHVRGVTTGMDVEWRFLPQPDGVQVSISHDLRLRWPLIGGLVADLIVGPLFVENIANKTLRRIKVIAEAQAISSTSQRW
jgi:uncharacterized membrane protein